MAKKVSKKAAKGAVATTNKGSNLPAKFDYGEHAGMGFENQTRDDIAMPFLNVLQALSPQVAEGTIEGAKAGMLFNTVTEELLDEVTFVPACTRHVFVEWVPREKGGGYCGEHEINSPVVTKAKSEADSFNDLKTPEGNQLVETFYIFGVLTDDTDAVSFITIACDSTKIKVYKKWNTRLQTFMLKTPDGAKVKPPMFAHHCRVTTTQESNNKGTWYNFHMGPADGGDIVDNLLPQEDPRYQAAMECRELVQSGIAAPAYDSVKREHTDEADQDDLPF